MPSRWEPTLTLPWEGRTIRYYLPLERPVRALKLLQAALVSPESYRGARASIPRTLKAARATRANHTLQVRLCRRRPALHILDAHELQ